MMIFDEIDARRSQIDRCRPIFIGAASRSGTTLLGAMLGVGPHALTVPEAAFKNRLMVHEPQGKSTTRARHALAVLAEDWKFGLWDLPLPQPWPDAEAEVGYRDLMTSLVLRYGERTGKPTPDVWIDHTPTNLKHGLSLARLFPDATFVHLVRDGRACMASWLPLDWGPNDPHEAAWYWATSAAYGLAAESALGPDRVLRVRYEDLLRQPEETLQRVCDATGLPFTSRMISERDYDVGDYTAKQHAHVQRPPDPSRIDAWRSKTAPRDVEIFEGLVGDILEAFGYEPDFGFGARVRNKPEHARHAAVGAARRLVLNRARRLQRRWRANV